MTSLRLAYGLNTDTIPAHARAIWGARLIWPNDLVHDRTSWDMQPDAEPDRQALQNWLNEGALRWTLERLANIGGHYEGGLQASEVREIVLYDDDRGVIVANPNASHGYLYVAAWLKPKEDQ
jgi:hypothetical protein